MALRNTGAVSARLTQKRRVMSTSSGLGPSSSTTVVGSRAMPQIGQSPGASRTISGCMGQVYSVRVSGSAMAAGSSAIPHMGQAPAPSCSTPAHMGQMYVFAPAALPGLDAPGPEWS
jgi:hypothetical protein